MKMRESDGERRRDKQTKVGRAEKWTMAANNNKKLKPKTKNKQTENHCES